MGELAHRCRRSSSIVDTIAPGLELGRRLRHDDERVGAAPATAMRCEPLPPTGRDDVLARLAPTTQRARVGPLARRRRRAARSAARAPSAGAAARRRASAATPAARTPRTTRSALTGLPGRPKNGVLSGPMMPKPCGMPGCIATLLELHRAEPAERFLDDVVGADADAAAGDDEVGADQLVLERVDQHAAGRPGTMPTRKAIAPASRAAAVEQRAVGVGDLARRQRLARVDQLAAGGQHDDARPRPHRAPARGRPRRAARSARRRDACRRAAPSCPAATSSPARRMCAPGVGRPVGSRTCAMPPSVHSSGTTASAPGGIGAPVMMRTHSPGCTV